MNRNHRNERKQRRGRFFATASAVALLAWPLAGAAAETSDTWTGEARDAWLDGRIEAAFLLNEHLNPFDIDTKVKGGEVTLSGAVDSQIDKDLAAEVARSVSGVSRVDNALEVKPEARKDEAAAEGQGVASRVSDATTTARVKMALLGNQSTSGLSIDVDTERGVVSLQGEVASEQEGDLAEKIAANTEGVARVENELKTKSGS